MSDQIQPPPEPTPTQTGIISQPQAPAPAPPTPSLRTRIADRVVNFTLIVALWAIAAIALFLYGWEFANAIGFGLIAGLFGAFFVRPQVMQILSKSNPSLFPPPAPAPTPAPAESARDVVETVVFVVVLVLLLKSFVAEAFVIPTGSMAQTLWGYQKVVTCPKCTLKFPVNCSTEVEESNGERAFVGACTCPNCRQKIHLIPRGLPLPPPVPGQEAVAIPDPGWGSGDRVLVSKYPYEVPGMGPHRLDVVVFKFPGDDGQPFPQSGPFKLNVAMNYIKRLVGLPGETIAIHRGKLYVLDAEKAARLLPYPDDDKARLDPDQQRLMWRSPANDRNRIDWMHVNDHRAREAFDAGQFTIVRKPPAILLDMMRLVHDNDLPAKDLTGEEYRRWVPARDSGWAEDEATRTFRHGGANDEITWLHYRHVLRDRPGKPQLITDFMGYNVWGTQGHSNESGKNWASDLVLECEAVSEKAEGLFALEVSRGPSRFQAEFDAATGQCTLYRVTGKAREKLLEAATAFKGAGTFRVRLANCDDRLTVWVNGKLAFGDGVEYKGPRGLTPTTENDLERPASIGARGGRFTAQHVKLYRDTYYTSGTKGRPSAADVPEFSPISQDTWGAVADAPVATYHVQPGHYLCLGDNSPESADSRSWGLVPRRLLLGKAVLVYFPFTRVGRIR